MAKAQTPRFRELAFLITGLIVGGLFTAFGLQSPVSAADAATTPAWPLEVTLYKYRIAEGKTGRFDEWMRWHAANHAGLIETLEPEQTYVEAIFRDREHDPRTFYWMVVKGKGGRPVEQSEHALDKVHLAYVRSVLDKTPRTTMATEMELVPGFITQATADHEARK